MKKLLSAVCMLAIAFAANAMPAKKIWQIQTQSDGTQIEVMLVGDEHYHYFITRDNVALVRNGSDLCYAKIEYNRLRPTSQVAHEKNVRSVGEQSLCVSSQDAAQLRQYNTKLNSRLKVQGSRGKTQKVVGDPNHPEYKGSKKGLIVLINFSNQTFGNYSEADNGEAVRQQYSDITNKEGYTNSAGAIGSVHDYFLDQSNGMFDLTFDVVGPVNLDKPYSYYGTDRSSDDIDWMMYELIETACQAIDDEVDFAIYDWDGDGEVEEVFFLYAGQGQATGGGADTIWPHMYSLEEWKAEYNQGNGAITLDGVKVNTYACSNEAYYGGSIMGIGVFCHEFSHCLGLPDLYDTAYGGNYGMATYDLLDSGGYNGPSNVGWVPAGYTAYERWYAGWMDMEELKGDTTIVDLKPINEEMKAFTVVNEAYPDEYYILECRNQTRWDGYIPSSGLLISYVDYDEEQWRANSVNTIDGDGDHQRMTIFRSSNSDLPGGWLPIPETYPFEDEYGWFGNHTNTELTDNSSPSAYLHHANTDGSYLMHKPIYDITRNSQTGTVSFNFRNDNKIEDAIGRIETANPDDVNSFEDFDIFTIEGKKVGYKNELHRLDNGIYILRNKQGKTKKIVI